MAFRVRVQWRRGCTSGLNSPRVTTFRLPAERGTTAPVWADHTRAVPSSYAATTLLPSLLNCEMDRNLVTTKRHSKSAFRHGPHQTRIFGASGCSGRTSAASGSAADIGNAPGVVRPSEYPSASARPRGNASFGSPSTSNAKICVPRPSSTHSDWGVVGEQRFSNNDQRSPLGLRIQSFRRHALIQQSKQRTEGLGLMRRALAMIPPWAAKLKVAEQSFKRHRMVSFQPLGFPQCGQARRVSRYSST